LPFCLFPFAFCLKQAKATGEASFAFTLRGYNPIKDRSKNTGQQGTRGKQMLKYKSKYKPVLHKQGKQEQYRNRKDRSSIAKEANVLNVIR